MSPRNPLVNRAMAMMPMVLGVIHAVTEGVYRGGTKLELAEHFV